MHRAQVSRYSTDAFVGRWVYIGAKGQTEYNVSRTSNGLLKFQGPDSNGDMLSGILQPVCNWLQAELATPNGTQVGFIRLSLVVEKCGILSHFMSLGKGEWGKDMISHRAGLGNKSAMVKFGGGTKALQRPTVVGCIGDSIMFNGYPKHLARILEERQAKAWEVQDFGVGSTTAINGIWSYTQRKRYVKALQSGADAIIIMLGTNDSKRANWDEMSYVEGLSGIIRTFLTSQGRDPPCIFLMTPPPTYEGSLPPMGFGSVRAPVVNKDLPKRILPRLAHELGTRLIDIFTPMSGWDLSPHTLFTDGVHPNGEGHTLIAKIVCNALYDAVKSGWLRV